MDIDPSNWTMLNVIFLLLILFLFSHSINQQLKHGIRANFDFSTKHDS